MISRRQAAWLVLALLASGQSVPDVSAQGAPLLPYQEYKDRIKKAEEMNVLSDNLMGDSVSLYNGSTEFSVTDVELPGNSALPVRLARRFKIESRKDVQNLGGFGIWDVEVPYIHGTFDGVYKWNQGEGGIVDRCSGNWAPRTDAPFQPRDIGGGVHVSLSGSGSEELHRITGDARMEPLALPSDGQTYRYVTKSGLRISCLPGTANGYAGQGFAAVDTAGNRYTFDIGIERHAGFMSAPFQGFTQTRERAVVYLMASEVRDRFGNWVKYEYTGDRLTAIRGSDGRLIELFYDNGVSYVTRARANGREWAYRYTAVTLALHPTGLLNEVQLPDQSTWAYDYVDQNLPDGVLHPEHGANDVGTDGPDCRAGEPGTDAFLFKAKSPSGAAASFQFHYKRHRRSGTPTSACVFAFSSSQGLESRNHYRLVVPDYFDTYSLVQKTITGPGLTGLTWGYTYPLMGSSRTTEPTPCTTCVSTKTVTVANPDGTKDEHVFGILYGLNDGRLLEVRTLDPASTVRKSVTTTYVTEAEAASMPFADIVGVTNASDDPASVRNRPVRSTVIAQDGSTFTSQSDAFDSMVRPIQVTKSSSLGYRKIEKTEYHDVPALWLMGQIKRSTVEDGDAATTDVTETARTDFHSNGLPWKSYRFGKLQYTLDYNADGTLKTVTDGRSHTTVLSSWKRGVPQQIQYPATPEAPAGAVQSAVVDNNGWIESVTDENGYLTSYGHDAVGRINAVTYPAADTVAWTPMGSEFRPLTSADAMPTGVVAGQWRHLVTHGNYRKVTYYDAFWRPVLVHEYDATQPAALRSTRTEYDTEGRVAFQSYPSTASVPPAKGTRTSYDTLGRVEQVSSDSELGVLTTTTRYEAGHKVTVTNPRLKSTTTSFMAFDTPTLDLPVAITHPEGAYTDIERDILGKPKALKRRNADGTLAVTRRYVYDANQQLCKTVEPETGATVMNYDAAGNLAWSASGLNLTGTTGCDTDAAYASNSRATREYDARNRVQSLTFVQGAGHQAWSYWPDGLVKTITTQNEGATATNSYTYNKRRLPTSETLTQAGGSALTVSYGYNALGALVSHQYPSGRTVAYAPNALGQPTQAGAYATGVGYYPNGAMSGFTYGNGIVHSLAQNDRGLPERSLDVHGTTKVLDDSYDYDANGNVLAISDGLPAGRGNRDMSYDGLDRLLTTTSPMFSPATYTYDVLDNLRTVKIGSRDHIYDYDASWRLTNVRNAVGGASVVGLGYDPQGNLDNKNGQGYRFDKGNRLREATGKEAYRYDGHGRRVQATLTSITDGPPILSMYGQDGVLRYQRNHREAKAIEYIHLNGSLVARVSDVIAPWKAQASAPGYNTQGSYTVQWPAVTGATTYEVQEAANSGSWADLSAGAALSMAVSGRAAGTYRYRARACNAAGCGEWGAAVSTTVELPPTGVPALTAPGTAANGDYTVSWNTVSAATSYVLEESVNSGAWTVVSSTAATSRSYTGRAAGTYAYRVKACNGAGCAGYSATSTVQAVYQPGGATISAPATSYTGSYTVSWTSVSGATGYRLEESANSSAWALIYDGAATSANVSGKSNGSYAYRVTACNVAGCAAVSASQAVQVTLPPGGVPTLSAPGSASFGNYTVTWSGVSTATSYTLEESAQGGAWTSAYSGASTSKAYSNRPAGSYAYRVKACNVAGCGGYSSTATVQSAYPPGPPGLSVPATSYTGGYTISWTSMATATSYRLDESFNGGAWTQIHQAATTSLTVSGRAAGSYSYRVTACNDVGCSAASSTASIQVTLPPTGTPTLSGPGTVYSGNYTLNWSTVSVATSHQLVERPAGGSFTVVFDGNASGATVSGRSPGTREYMARGCNVAGCGPWSAIATVQVIGPPGTPAISGPTSAGSGATYTLNWGAVATADSYQLEESANGGAWAYVAGGTSASFAKTSGGPYAYRVRACNPAGCGAYSATHSVSIVQVPAVPTGLAITYRSAAQCRVVWNGSAGATSYNLSGPRFVVYSGGQTSFVYDAQCHTSYKVQACNAQGCSAWSAPVY